MKTKRRITYVALGALTLLVLALGILLAAAVDAPVPAPAREAWQTPTASASFKRAPTDVAWGHDQLDAMVPATREPPVKPGLPPHVKPLPTQAPFVTPPERIEAPTLPPEL
jgi:hypothetical protein